VLLDASPALVDHLGDLAFHLKGQPDAPLRPRLRDGRWLVA
jgi:hypothetical protein